MRNYITAKAAIATLISAVCFGTGAVTCFAATAAPASVSASVAHVTPNGSPWD